MKPLKHQWKTFQPCNRRTSFDERQHLFWGLLSCRFATTRYPSRSRVPVWLAWRWPWLIPRVPLITSEFQVSWN